MAYLGLLLATLLACSLSTQTAARHLVTRTVTPKKAVVTVDGSYSAGSRKPLLKGINRLASSLEGAKPLVNNDPIGPAAEKEEAGSSKDPPGKPGKGQFYWPGIKGYDGPLQYNGGTVKVKTLDVHILFYGSWSKHDGKDQKVITNFVKSLSDDSADDKVSPGCADLHPALEHAPGQPIINELSLIAHHNNSNSLALGQSSSVLFTLLLKTLHDSS